MNKTGHSLFSRQQRLIGALSAIETGSGGAMLTRRDVLHLLQDALDIGDRHARRAATIYGLENWTEPNSGLNAPFGQVNSVSARIQSHAAQTDKSHVENGSKGGRPRKPLDTPPGSTGLWNTQCVVETQVEEAHDHRLGDIWRL